MTKIKKSMEKHTPLPKQNGLHKSPGKVPRLDNSASPSLSPPPPPPD